MKEKKIPSWIHSQLLRQIIRSRPGIYISYWIFQGMFYMNYKEFIIKILLDAGIMVFVAYVFRVPFYFGFLLAHTLNMLFNGHYFAMRRHMGLGKNDPKHFIEYIEGMKERIENKSCILAAAAYGSLSKNHYLPTSDIDIRFVPRNNLKSFLQTYLIALSERARAFVMQFPLDLYVFSLEELDRKMSPKEPPIIFCDAANILSHKYGVTVKAGDFILKFRSVHV